MSTIYTTKTGAKVLGVLQDTLKCYANRFGIGSQPGGPGTPYLFTVEDLRALRKRGRVRLERTEKNEDREALGLGPLYNKDGSPR